MLRSKHSFISDVCRIEVYVLLKRMESALLLNMCVSKDIKGRREPVWEEHYTESEYEYELTGAASHATVQ